MTTVVKKTNGWFKYLGTAITIVVLSAGIITSWATNNAALDELQRNQVKIEERIKNAEDKIHEIELKAVADSSILQSVKEDIAEIKSDVKQLLEK